MTRNPIAALAILFRVPVDQGGCFYVAARPCGCQLGPPPFGFKAARYGAAEMNRPLSY